jgi:hypothetical protein
LFWGRRADNRTKRGKITLTKVKLLSRLWKGKSIIFFVDLACSSLYSHATVLFSFKNQNPVVFQKKGKDISTFLLLKPDICR